MLVCACINSDTAVSPLKVRPVLASEAVDSGQCCVSVVSRDQLVLGRDRQFRFDHVFDTNTSQVKQD